MDIIHIDNITSYPIDNALWFILTNLAKFNKSIGEHNFPRYNNYFQSIEDESETYYFWDFHDKKPDDARIIQQPYAKKIV